MKKDAAELISAILVQNPKLRPTVVEILSMPWVKRMQTELEIADKAIPEKKRQTDYQVDSLSKKHTEMEEYKETKSVNGKIFLLMNWSIVVSEAVAAIDEIPRALLYGYPGYEEPKKGKIRQEYIHRRD